MQYFNKAAAMAAMAGIAMLSSCEPVNLTDHTLQHTQSAGKEPRLLIKTDFESASVTPSLVKALPGFGGLKIYPLISSDDKLPQSPDFFFAAQPDGAAFMKNPNDKGYIMINNHEINFSVSRVYLDEHFKPVKGEYIVNAAGGRWRLCSATLATPEEHGFGPVFLTAGESGPESMVHAIDPLAPANPSDPTRVKPALGMASMENAVPLPKDAFPGKTVIIIGEDDGNGQLIAYVSDQVGDLDNGKLYVLKRTNDTTIETDMTMGNSYEVEFTEIKDVQNLTAQQIQAATVAQKAIQFARVEDIDYRKGGKGNSREIYFTATGVSESDKITPVPGKTMWGRIYKLNLDAGNPLKGMLSIVADGGVDPGNNIVNPDNLCVTEHYVYIQEDGDSFYKQTGHDGRIWQYNIEARKLKPMLEMDHRRDDQEFNAKYNPLNSLNLSSWEYGAMLDISDIVGVPNTFLVNIHPHTWREAKFSAASASAGLNSSPEGGQTVIITGIPR